MILPIGNHDAHMELRAAISGGTSHHAWLFTGPQGVGKASFARVAALRLLAEAAGEPGLTGDFDMPLQNPTRHLVAAGSHPDYRELIRLPKEAHKPDQDIARSISVAQVRGLQPLFATTPSMSPRRIVLIDSVDDLERPGASNALLKSLEEPPSETIFFLISHAPGRLLPTIRSRCRRLRFDPLSPAEMATVLQPRLPDASSVEVAALIKAGDGSPGRALGYAGLEMAALDNVMATIAKDGDATNAERTRLAKQLAPKAAQPRYEAFLDLAPTFIAQSSVMRTGPSLRVALDAYERARALAVSARALSLDQQATVYEMAGLVASLARPD